MTSHPSYNTFDCGLSALDISVSPFIGAKIEYALVHFVSAIERFPGVYRNEKVSTVPVSVRCIGVLPCKVS